MTSRATRRARSSTGGNGDATNCAQARTAALIPPADAVLSLGDNQYENGTLPKFLGSYDLTWGRFKPIIHPVPGNHDYAAGYYDYFGPSAGTPGEGWYSFDLGAWHILALNSECDVLPAGTCSSGGAEEAFVRQDLAAHPTACTLAFWHEPRFSSGSAAVVNAAAMAPIWNDLEQAGADLVLSAHKHFYERFAPLSASGGVDAAHGMRELIVGTGGDDHAGGASPVAAGSQIRNDTTFGVLKLALDGGGYSWHFVPEAGLSFTDSGTGTCH